MTATTDIATIRAKRFEDIKAGYEADGPDGTEPGAATPAERPARYVVITESSRGFGYFANYATTLSNVEVLAAANLHEGWEPVCYFDLDVLAGDEPLPGEVLYQGEEWMVHGFEYESSHEWDAEAQRFGPPSKTGKWVLKKSPKDRRRRTYDWATVDPSEVDLMGWEDERMPVRFKVAGIRKAVAFNTSPEPPA